MRSIARAGSAGIDDHRDAPAAIIRNDVGESVMEMEHFDRSAPSDNPMRRLPSVRHATRLRGMLAKYVWKASSFIRSRNSLPTSPR